MGPFKLSVDDAVREVHKGERDVPDFLRRFNLMVRISDLTMSLAFDDGAMGDDIVSELIDICPELEEDFRMYRGILVQRLKSEILENGISGELRLISEEAGGACSVLCLVLCIHEGYDLTFVFGPDEPPARLGSSSSG